MNIKEWFKRNKEHRNMRTLEKGYGWVCTQYFKYEMTIDDLEQNIFYHHSFDDFWHKGAYEAFEMIENLPKHKVNET